MTALEETPSALGALLAIGGALLALVGLAMNANAAIKRRDVP